MMPEVNLCTRMGEMLSRLCPLPFVDLALYAVTRSSGLPLELREQFWYKGYKEADNE